MENENFLDTILLEIGDFGKYQKRTCVLLILVTLMAYFGTVIFVFEAKQINHRCEILECESNPPEFKPSWWKNAIPEVNEEPCKCSKYRRLTNNVSTCSSIDFDRSIEETCTNFVYETPDISILQDFNLQCEENIWKLTFIGTIRGLGFFMGVPISGILSDRYGRKIVIICAMLTSGIVALIRTFSTSYEMFVVFSFLEPLCGAGALGISYTLALEFVGSKKRGLVSFLITFTSALGGVLEGGLAWILQSWRNLVRILYSTYLLVFFYYWLLPESVRWLLAKNKYAEASTILANIAKVNGKTVSQNTIDKINTYESHKDSVKKNTVKELFTSVKLVLRLVNCWICWICCIFLFNGLTIYAVALSENNYLDFILSILVELPASAAAYIAIETLGRKWTLSLGYMIAGLTCIASTFVPPDIYWLTLVLYLLGKFGISMNISVIYIITTEMFPTPFRGSLLSTCSMFGRIGSMVGPQMPLLERIWEPLPLVLFGSAGILATFLSLLFPETKNTTLPNTIKEAENIGK